MNEIRQYALNRGLTPLLTRKLVSYYNRYLDHKTAFDEAKIMEELSESLRTEIMIWVNGSIVKRLRKRAKAGGGRGPAPTTHTWIKSSSEDYMMTKSWSIGELRGRRLNKVQHNFAGFSKM